jgi:SAM-dependent methyltransferase
MIFITKGKMSQKDVVNKIPIYKLKTTDEVMNFYDDWGIENKYDKDMLDWKYSGPQESTEIFKRYAKDKNIKIYDAGCGTGLVGVELKKFEFNNFDGADLSQKLLDLVPNNLYKKLNKVDLNKPIDIKNDTYDAVMCIGTFTFGHVKPPALDEFIRITKNKGLICFTINEGIYEEYGFDKKIEELLIKKKWKKIEFFKSNYIASKDVNAWLGLYEVKK